MVLLFWRVIEVVPDQGVVSGGDAGAWHPPRPEDDFFPFISQAELMEIEDEELLLMLL